MEHMNKFKYYVITFLELPYEDIDEYVCVPWSWIVLRRKMDQKVIVSYPVEKPSETAKRVKRRQKHSEDWKLYLSVVKYSTDVYEDAKIFINGKINEKKISTPVKRKIHRLEQNSKSNHKIDKSLDLNVTLKNDDNSETKQLYQSTLSTPVTETALKRSKVVESSESVSDATEQPSQAPGCLSENQSSLTRDDSPIQNSCSPEVSVEESDDRSCVEEIEHTENSEQERPSVIENSTNLTNSLANPKLMIDFTLLMELLTVLQNLHTVSADSYTLVGSLRKELIELKNIMEEVKQLIIDVRTNGFTLTTSSTTNSTMEVEKISEKNKRKQKQQDEEDDGHGDDDDIVKVPKKRFKKRKFVLPPEYDENDSRWTLRYRELAPGLVELMPHTNVYVPSIRLLNCKRLAKDCKSLTRMLLVEIFTKNALTICSLTGSRARAYDVEGATIRPGLDENARTVLLTYVEEYGRENGWITEDTQSILNSVRNKMQDYRLKYG